VKAPVLDPVEHEGVGRRRIDLAYRYKTVAPGNEKQDRNAESKYSTNTHRIVELVAKLTVRR